MRKRDYVINKTTECLTTNIITDIPWPRKWGTWLILILWNSMVFRALDLFSSWVFPTLFSSWDNRPVLTAFVSFCLALDISLVVCCCSGIELREPLLEELPSDWTCKTSSLATDSATFSSHVLSKDDVRLNSGFDPQTIFAFKFCNLDTWKEIVTEEHSFAIPLAEFYKTSIQWKGWVVRQI